MGAKQRGQARSKKATKGSMKGQPMSQKQITQSTSIPDLSPSARARSLQNWGKFAGSPGFAGNGFSMSEEAKNTDRRGFGWGTAPLRTQAISFVSAGPLRRDEDAWNTVSEDDSPHKQSDIDHANEHATPTPEPQDAATTALASDDVSLIPQRDTKATAQVQDEAVAKEDEVNGSSRPHFAMPSPPPVEELSVMRDAVASPSSDSDEEIVFSGRIGLQLPSRKPTPAPPLELKKDTLTDQTTPAPFPVTTFIPVSQTITSTALQKDPPIPVSAASSAHSRPTEDVPFGQKFFSRKNIEEEIMQDYIDNMALDDSEDEDDNAVEEAAGALPYRKGFRRTEHFRLFDGDGLENEKVQTTSKRKSHKTRAKPDQAIDWDSDDLADFDDLSTTDEEIEGIDQVLRHRTRISGAQYLVIATGTSASDAKWILHSKLISKSAVSEIKIYEEIRQMNIEEDELDSESDGSDAESNEEALQDLLDNIESEDDENERIMRYTSRMTDEQIARALAKQEELGLGSEELMIFDGEAANGTETPDNTFGLEEDFIPFSLSKHTSNRGRSKRNKKQRDSFPSAEAFADALDQDPYGAFDIMDFERPSLRPKKKGRKSDYPFDLEGLEDDDLKDQLVNTWTKDREKKAERKRQREEARLTANLSAADGGDPEIIKTRIRQFLVQEVDVLKLSPMESHVRAGIHRLAKSLKLNSRSEGKDGLGLGRYPVLTKTPYTPHYTVHTIWQVDELMNLRKFFPKSMYKNSKGPRSSGVTRPRRGGGGGGGVMSGATYRDGEEVAASAPEIGADNRGRAMLEKMGWVQGTGIGAVGNKGGLDPIRHIVKTTKAGLG